MLKDKFAEHVILDTLSGERLRPMLVSDVNHVNCKTVTFCRVLKFSLLSYLSDLAGDTEVKTA